MADIPQAPVLDGHSPRGSARVSRERSVGAGVYELRIRAAGAYRVFFVAKFAEGIYVLHAFKKKTQQTARLDLELGAKRYREVLAQRPGR